MDLKKQILIRNSLNNHYERLGKKISHLQPFSNSVEDSTQMSNKPVGILRSDLTQFH